MPLTSRIEQARDEIVADFSGITTALGYRNDPNVVTFVNPTDAATDLPEIGVAIGTVKIEPKDSSWTVYDILAQVWVRGTVTYNTDTGENATNQLVAAESLRHDIIRKTGEMTNKYLTHTGSRWNIDSRQPLTFYALMPLRKQGNVGAFYSSFYIRIRSTANTFMYEVSGGADGPSADVVIDAGTL